VQPARLNRAGNFPIGHVCSPQLLSRNHSMLPSRNLGQTVTTSGVPFGPHRSIRHTAAKLAPSASGKMRFVGQNGDMQRGRYEGPAQRLFAVRGAVQAEANEGEAILAATEELMRELIERNGLPPEAMVSCLFTTTDDLDAEFPAVAARDLGLTVVPLMCCREIPVPGSMPRVIRVMLHFYAPEGHQPVHVYVGEAQKLRADLEAAQ
jgi:chorismate mutase